MMRHILTWFSGVMLMTTSTFAQTNEIALTVYNNNRALVKDTRTLTLETGVRSIQFKDVAAQIDPTSVHFKSLTAPDKITLLEQNYEYDLVNTAKLLEKYVDQDITVITKEQTYRGKLLSASGGEVMLQEPAGTIRVIQQAAILNLEFPALPAGLITRPTLVWLVNNQKAGAHQTQISYLTEGINWHAEYVAVTLTNDTELELSGWVSIDNHSGATYPNARLKLVAGEVHLVQPPALGKGMYDRAVMSMEAAAAPQFEEKEFFEYHLYTLQRAATVKDNEIKQISLFSPVTAKVGKIYTYDGQKNQEKVQVNLEFKNSKEAGLGMALPAGKIRVYKEDPADNSLEFIGEDAIKHTPKDEKVRIFLGNAFDIVGERSQQDQKQISKRAREESFTIKLRNHKSENIEVVVVEHAWGDWEIRNNSHPYQKKDAHTFEFKVPVLKDGETVVTYVILTRW
ncbi:DUF4139 domain-containing protein [candidate division KSB1 bacterium]|nr:DUF4139 domain-containing protein [candidate division KSB1 bacterium]